MDGKLRAYRLNITGRVQGVGFRYSAQREASRLGLTGWVRNEPDGSVSLYFEGLSEKTASFLKWLEKGGPSMSYITGITKITKTPLETYLRFTIDY